MRKANLLLVSLVGSLVFACSAPASPTQPRLESSKTPVSTLTSTARPTATEKPLTPTLTPVPGLQTNGPYFAYFQQDAHGIRRLVFLDADGVGRKVMELPKAIGEAFAAVQPPAADIRWVSPDGKWLAFHTGSAGDFAELPAQKGTYLNLNLLDLTTGKRRVLTPLLSEDYPNNFVEAARQLSKDYPSNFVEAVGPLNDPDDAAKALYQAFVVGITRALAWSPDGRYLAFASQMDGFSSDLFLYDVETNEIRRLSSGDQELQWIDWSPDGRWIMHSGVYWVGLGMNYDIYAATIDGGSAPHISTNIEDDGIDTWLNTHQYLENDGQNGPGRYGLRLVDVDTGKITKVWGGSFDTYAVAKNGMWAAVYAQSSDSGPLTHGGNADFVSAIYLINLLTLEKTRVEFPDTSYLSIKVFGLNGQEFVVGEGRATYAMFLSTDGILTNTRLINAKIFVSPNAEYWLVVTGETARLFSADNTLIHENAIPLPDAFITDVSWRPDSSGLFIISGSTILSMNVSDGDVRVIEQELISDDDRPTYMWVNGQ